MIYLKSLEPSLKFNNNTNTTTDICWMYSLSVEAYMNMTMEGKETGNVKFNPNICLPKISRSYFNPYAVPIKSQ